MGYDVSFHPISPEEMREWYFTPLTWIQQGQEEKVLALAAQHGMEDFYTEKYLNTLRVGAETESNELFDKSHGFYIAVVQGFSAITITPGKRLFLPVGGEAGICPVFHAVGTGGTNRLSQSGRKSDHRKLLLRCVPVSKAGRAASPGSGADAKGAGGSGGLWRDGQFAVLKKALTAAAELGVGLLEATEVVEPNPISPNESTSYSNLYHCDRDGVYLYMDTVSRQSEDAIRKSEE